MPGNRETNSILFPNNESGLADRPKREAGGTDRRAGWGVALLVVAGATIRLIHYAGRPSYWNDEAAIVMNIMRRSYVALLRPLSYAQVAPPLFLWAERFIYHTFGPSEYAMRSLPLMLGLGSLFVFAAVAWRILPPAGALWAVGWFAFCDKLILPAYEVKQYSGDIFVGIALLMLACGGTRIGRETLQAISPARFLVLCLAAAAGIWLSYPAAFLFGGISVAFLPSLVGQHKRGWLAWGAGNLLVAGSFAALYLVAIRPGHDRYLEDFWKHEFIDWSRPARISPWFVMSIYHQCDYFFSGIGVLVFFMSCAGGIALCRGGRGRVLGIFLGALALNLVAAGLHKYPFAGKRVTVYLMPLQFLIMGAGTDGILVGVWGRVRKWWWVIPFPLLVAGILQSVKHTFRPEDGSTIRPVAQWLREHRKPDEAIYLAADGDPRRDRPTGRNIDLKCYWPDPGGKVYELLPSPDKIHEKRFWVVYSLTKPKERFKIDPATLGIVTTTYPAPPNAQAGAFLVERHSKPASRATSEPAR